MCRAAAIIAWFLLSGTLGCANFTSEAAGGGGGEDGGTGGAAAGGGDAGAQGGAGTAGGAGSGASAAIDPEPQEDVPLSVVCAVGVVTSASSELPWRISIDPGPIETGSLFSASLSGVAVFTESFLDTGQDLIVGGFEEVHLVDAQATVLAYSGATGEPAVMYPSAPHECALAVEGVRAPCDPANDLPGLHGVRGNTDCEPEGDFNPCGRFIPMPTSPSCEPQGVCWNLGREGDPFCPTDDFCNPVKRLQCESNGFCVTGPLDLPFASTVQEYLADDSGVVLYGWHEPDRGNPWSYIPSPLFADPLGPIGFRLLIGPAGVPFECRLGTDHGEDEFGPVDDEALLSFPIAERGCIDETQVCPDGYTASVMGDCRLLDKVSPITVEDPMGSPAVCPGLSEVRVYQSALPVDDPEVLTSPSFVAKATIEAKNVQDEACLASTENIGNIEFWDEDKQKLSNRLLTFSQPSEVAVPETNPLLRTAYVSLRNDVGWSSSPDVCCVRTFQTVWEVRVGRCEGW